jgi:hypothetical protein
MMFGAIMVTLTGSGNASGRGEYRCLYLCSVHKRRWWHTLVYRAGRASASWTSLGLRACASVG